VDNIYAYAPFGGGPHFSAGHVGLGPVVRSLMEGGRSDVLWDVMQEDTRPSYGFNMLPTTAQMLHVLLLIVSIWMAFWGTFTLTIGSFAYQRLFFLVLEVSLAAALIALRDPSSPGRGLLMW